MIPKFPALKKIELSDFEEIHTLVKEFPPYNDFEFLSLWTYNEGDLNEVSMLNNNLVIRIQDFITNEFFYSFIGVHDVRDTIEKLLKKSTEEGLEPKLWLVPEESVTAAPDLGKQFSITEDLDSFDYILSTDAVAELQGGEHHDKRNMVTRFQKDSPDNRVQSLTLADPKIKQEVLDLFFRWEKQRGKDRKDTKTELTAIQRLFDLIEILQIKGTGVYNKDELIGFSTYHIVDQTYAILSFEKGDTNYPGIYEYINNQTAKYLQTLKIKYINYEQDLGIPGLKKAKLLWRPVFYLKKYTIGYL